MKLIPGDKAKRIQLTDIDKQSFDSDSLIGKPYLLSFFRFANCPFCNLRMMNLVNAFPEFGDDFTIVAIFDSPLDHLRKYAEGHHAPFPILADPSNQYYAKYQIEHSLKGMLKGMFTRFPTLVKGLLKGYIPLFPKGSMTTMPADFLIDRNGIIQNAYYAKDEGDHLDLEVIKQFSLQQ